MDNRSPLKPDSAPSAFPSISSTSPATATAAPMRKCLGTDSLKTKRDTGTITNGVRFTISVAFATEVYEKAVL